MKNIKITVVMFFALFVSVGLFAQRSRGYKNRHYTPSRHHSNQHSHISIRAVTRYHYRPAYRSYYRYAPTYRPIVRSVYRSPGAYVHFGPVYGVRINVLPFGYSNIFAGSKPFYYYNGIFYRNYSHGGYEVVAPPLNASVKKLPVNAAVTVIDGQKYYQAGGTYYQEEISDDNLLSYRVVGTDGVLNTGIDNGNEDLNTYDEDIPALGSRYDELPTDAKVQIINQQKYFITTGGIYYKEVIEENRIRYEVTTVE